MFYLYIIKINSYKNMKRSFIITLCLLMAGFAMQVNGQTNVTIVTDANFEKEVLFSKDMVLVYFYASWSGPCRIANPVITKFANDYKGKVKVCKIDADDNPPSIRICPRPS